MNTYMIVERNIPGKQKELYQRFMEKGRLLPEGVHYINSWVSNDLSICFQLMQSETEEGLKEWMANWEDVTHFEHYSIINSEEASKQILNDN